MGHGVVDKTSVVVVFVVVCHVVVEYYEDVSKAVTM